MEPVDGQTLGFRVILSDGTVLTFEQERLTRVDISSVAGLGRMQDLLGR